MGFKPGNKLAGSRKGIPNRASLEAALILSSADYRPAEKLIEVSQIAMARFAEELELVDKGRLSPMESKAATYLKIVLDANRELASFVHPKLKSIERVKEPSPLDGLPDHQRLKMMEDAVKVFRAQINSRKEEDGPGAL